MTRCLLLVLAMIATTTPAVGGEGAKGARSQAEEFQGRLGFMGEFNLYPFPITSPRAKECISGAFSLKKHLRVKRRYQGKVVKITGKKVTYASLVEQIGATERGWKGTPIPNYCGRDYVILAEKLRVID